MKVALGDTVIPPLYVSGTWKITSTICDWHF